MLQKKKVLLKEDGAKESVMAIVWPPAGAPEGHNWRSGIPLN